jgi:SnoaL-like domain
MVLRSRRCRGRAADRRSTVREIIWAKPSVEDCLAIDDLLMRYTTVLDAGDVESVVDCFTEDRWLDSPIVGQRRGRRNCGPSPKNRGAHSAEGAGSAASRRISASR